MSKSKNVGKKITIVILAITLLTILTSANDITFSHSENIIFNANTQFNEELNLEEAQITNFFDQCPSEEAITQINEDGSVDCIETGEVEANGEPLNLEQVLKEGDDAAGQNITGINQIIIEENNGVLIGNNETSSGDENAIAIGRDSNAEGDSSIAIGEDSKASNEGAMAFGAEAFSDKENTAIFGSSETPYNVGVTGDLNVSGDLKGVDNVGAGSQNLAQVLEEGNRASEHIDMNDFSLEDVGGADFTGDLNMGENQLQGVSSLFLQDGEGLAMDADQISGVDGLSFRDGISIGDSETQTGIEEAGDAENILFASEQWDEKSEETEDVVTTSQGISLNATSSDFNQKWDHDLHDSGITSIAAEEGIVYSGGGGFGSNKVIAFDSTFEEELWRHELHEGDINGIAVEDGIVYSGGADDTVIAFDGESEEELWSHELHDESISSVEVENNIIYSAGFDDRVIAFDGESEEELWSHNLHDSSVRGLAVENGIIYSAGNDDAVIAFDGESEEKLWSHSEHLDNSVLSIDVEDGIVYSASDTSGINDAVIAFDSEDEEKIWGHTDQDTQVNSVSVEDSVAYFGNSDRVVAFDGESEEELWVHELHGLSVDAVAVEDGVVYSGDDGFESEDIVVAVESIVQYAEEGVYQSNILDSSEISGDVTWSSVDVSSELKGQSGEITVEFSNQSDMGDSVSETWDIVDGIDNRVLDRRAEYAQLELKLESLDDLTETPRVNLLDITYGSSPAEIGLEQIALGNSASTTELGAVAIGRDSVSNQEDTAVFGSDERPYDVDVTGDLDVSGVIEESNVDDLSYSIGHTAWSSDLENEEIHRFGAGSEETIVVDRVDFQLKGGGSDSDLSLTVTDGTSEITVDAGDTDTSSTVFDEGESVVVEISNDAGDTVEGSIMVNGRSADTSEVGIE